MTLPTLAYCPGEHHHRYAKILTTLPPLQRACLYRSFRSVISPVEVSSPPLLRSPYSFLSHQTVCQNLLEAKQSTIFFVFFTNYQNSFHTALPLDSILDCRFIISLGLPSLKRPIHEPDKDGSWSLWLCWVCFYKFLFIVEIVDCKDNIKQVVFSSIHLAKP